MAANLPDGISRDHLLAAIRQFDDGVAHRFADSTGYDVLFEERRYPPKAIVGLAARLLTGEDLGPEDFSGGRGSKCFGVLQRCGFEIVEKAVSGMWLFQGNPSRYDIDDYVSRYRYLYWTANRSRASMRLGDPVVLWRAGRDAGAIAVGRVTELPCPKADVRYPECLGDDLWRDSPDSPTDFKVGIEIDESRLDREDGLISRDQFLESPTLAASQIIRSPTGTVFRLTEDEAREFLALWRSATQPTAGDEAIEGARRLRQHYARERCRVLIDRKRDTFAREHGGRVFCEVCGFNFAERYPPSLGNGFIEVHHLSPLSTHDEPRRTTLADLLLVCANCHRMIHRTRDAEANLVALRAHFSG